MGDDTMDPINEYDRKAKEALERKDWAALVLEFHEAQGQFIPGQSEAHPPEEVTLLRLRLMHE